MMPRNHNCIDHFISIAWRPAFLLRSSLFFTSSFQRSVMTSLVNFFPYQLGCKHLLHEVTWRDCASELSSLLIKSWTYTENVPYVLYSMTSCHSGESLCFYLHKHCWKHPCPLCICVRQQLGSPIQAMYRFRSGGQFRTDKQIPGTVAQRTNLFDFGDAKEVLLL